MRNKTRRAILAIAVTGFVSGCNQTQQAKVSCALNDKPMNDSHCAERHAANGKGSKASGFSVDAYHSLVKGTSYGPVIVTRDPASSTLYRMVSGKVDAALPTPHGKESLSSDEIHKIELWIEQEASQV